jgi:adenylate kinase family enzyme
MNARADAILLIGPTGAGKTPLGDYLDENGLEGRRCHHFDFGAHLRRAAESPAVYSRLTGDDIQVISGSLETGALLTDHQFHIAERLLASFMDNRSFRDDDLLVLNGLPRHPGQARAAEGLINIISVIYLKCDEKVVFGRIKSNSGGDRTGRTDDSRDAVARKLRIFLERTRPLLHHYDRALIPVKTVRISDATTPADVISALGDEQIIP